MTISAHRSVVIDRPIEEVFDFLADGTNNRRWRPGVIEIERTSTAQEVGATYRQVMRGPLGMSIRGDYKIIRHDPPETLEFQVIAGPARPRGRFHLTEEPEGRTDVTFSLELEPTGLTRVIAGVVRRQMEQEVAAMDALARELETA